jgi:hypothetical protein
LLQLIDMLPGGQLPQAVEDGLPVPDEVGKQAEALGWTASIGWTASTSRPRSHIRATAAYLAMMRPA